MKKNKEKMIMFTCRMPFKLRNELRERTFRESKKRWELVTITSLLTEWISEKLHT